MPSRSSRPSRRAVVGSAGGLAAAAVLPSGAGAAPRLKPGRDAVLIVVDVQNSFLPGGSLAVDRGDEIIPLVNRIAGRFQNVVLTQDCHPADHASFASQHPGRKPFDTIEAPYGRQVLWPDHCVQGTDGASISSAIDIPHAQLVIRKGFHRKVDSYSAFLEADGKTRTGLAGYLDERRIKAVYVAGLATDFCVAATAMDARRAGFEASVIEDACRGIDASGSLAAAWAAMAEAGVRRIHSTLLA